MIYLETGCDVPCGGVRQDLDNLRPGYVPERTITRYCGEERGGESQPPLPPPTLTPTLSHPTPDAWYVQNCTDHAVMLLTHPNRKYKPPRPRAGRFHRRAPAAGDGGEGPSPWGATAAPHDDLHVGGKASFPGTTISSRGGWGKGEPSAQSDAARGVAAEGDVTLVEPGKVRGCCRGKSATHRLIRGL